MPNDIETELFEFNNQNNQVQDKIKAELHSLINGIKQLGVEETKLNPYIEKLIHIEELYFTRLTNWKNILKKQKDFYLEKLEKPLDDETKNENRKEALKQLQKSYKELNERVKSQNKELEDFRVAVEVFKNFEKKYYEVKYRYDELRHNTGNFHKR